MCAYPGFKVHILDMHYQVHTSESSKEEYLIKHNQRSLVWLSLFFTAHFYRISKNSLFPQTYFRYKWIQSNFYLDFMVCPAWASQHSSTAQSLPHEFQQFYNRCQVSLPLKMEFRRHGKSSTILWHNYKQWHFYSNICA